MAEDKGISLVILGIVAICAVVGLVLLFSGAISGRGLYGGGILGDGGKGTYDRYTKASTDVPTYTGARIKGNIHDKSFYANSPATTNTRVAPFATPSQGTNPCTPGFIARRADLADYSVVDRFGKEWACTYAGSLSAD